jgi:hypothetical protein
MLSWFGDFTGTGDKGAQLWSGTEAWVRVIGEVPERSLPALYQTHLGIAFRYEPDARREGLQKREFSITGRSLSPLTFVDLVNADGDGRALRTLNVHDLRVYEEPHSYYLVVVSFTGSSV